MRGRAQTGGAAPEGRTHSQRLDIERLARAADISPSTLSRLETGKRQASLELLLPLTKKLGITVDDLLASPVRDPRWSETGGRPPTGEFFRSPRRAPGADVQDRPAPRRGGPCAHAADSRRL
ncbi:helix-turn-helix transcriptional regulator [Nesterenkonia pannonica]|uniref:helix-turn-helix domain-containing protein n=1 Tax=Nesterenkonia pannonica TaxID=1548602 RepID=UPI0021645E1A|nr:helix-turn-helix transcriptional regulator [Nesterenkonia pannonica]